MPENASTRTIDRDRLRSRLVSPRSTGKRAAAGVSPSSEAQGRPAQFEQSPVLFRLPAIASVAPGNSAASGNSAAVPDDIAASGGIAAAFEASRGGASHTKQSEASELRSESELRSDDEHALDIASVEPSAHFQASGQQQPSQVLKKAAANQQQLSSVSPLESSLGESVQVAAESAVEASSEQRRTWWEHWSSGVVLILLVVALVVASIIAFNDGETVKSGQMAGQLEASMLDEFDLSSIAIPDISMPPLGDSATRRLSTVAQDASSPSGTAQAPSATEPVARDSAARDSAGGDLAAAEKAAVDKALSDKALSDKALGDKAAGEATEPERLAGGDVAPGAAGQAAPEPAVQVATAPIAPLPLATLDKPTEVSAPQLFAQDNLPGESGLSAGFNRISSLPASNPAVSLELPPREATHVDGSSPTFYDGASHAGEHTVSGAAGPIDTNMPSMATVLASATASVGTGNAPAAQVVSSATPDLNGESIAEAYLRFKQLHQATTGPTANRYPGPPLPE